MRCSWICELKQEENFTGICNNILIYHHLVQIGEEQHTYCVTVQKASIEICSRKYLWEDQHFYQSYSLQELFKGFSAFLENGSFFKTNFADIFWNVHFFVKQYIETARDSELDVLLNSWRNFWKLSLIKVIYSKFVLSNFNQKWDDDLEY